MAYYCCLRGAVQQQWTALRQLTAEMRKQQKSTAIKFRHLTDCMNMRDAWLRV
jgi:protein involved in temperature-dependent protein secretion